MIKKLLLVVVALAVAVVGFGAYKSAQKPKDLWVSTGKLAACVEGSTCVSSMATDELHQIPPLGYPGHDVALVREKLEESIKSMPGATIQTATNEYLHVVYQGPLGLRDDVELLIESAVVQVRSVSRVGMGDNAGNRARIEQLRAIFEKQFATTG